MSDGCSEKVCEPARVSKVVHKDSLSQDMVSSAEKADEHSKFQSDLTSGIDEVDNLPIISSLTLEVVSLLQDEGNAHTESQLQIPKCRQLKKWILQMEMNPSRNKMFMKNLSSIPTTFEIDDRLQRVPLGYDSCAPVFSAVSPNRVIALPGIESLQASKKNINKTPSKVLEFREREEDNSNSESISDEYLTAYLKNDMNRTVSWKKVKMIGSGSSSYVYLYRSVDSELEGNMAEVAVKSIKYPEELQSSEKRETLKMKETLFRIESSLTQELSVLKDLDHQCIVKLLAINDPEFLTNERPLSSRCNQKNLPPFEMVMSYCAGGDILDLAKQNLIPDWLIQRIFAELVHAVKYLHDNLIIHRDLKLENVLLKFPLNQIILMRDKIDTAIIELGDFGLSKKIKPDELCTTRCGSEDYVSPEILMGLPYDGRLCDTWALGVLLYALLEDRFPFDPLNPPLQRNRIQSTAHRIAQVDWHWLKLAGTDHPAKGIVEKCLVNRKTRWNIDQIKNHHYVTNIALGFSSFPNTK